MKQVYRLFFLFLFMLFQIYPDESFAKVKHDNTVKVIFERVYLDGEVSEEIKTEPFSSIDRILAKYNDWIVVNLDDEEVVLQKQIDDISPLLKTNGYFGLLEDGTLSIFNGKPADKNEVIQSFYQIDVEKLESFRHSQLKKGIPVKNKKHYLKVIEGFQPYSLEH